MNYESSRHLYVPTPPVFAYCSGLYKAGGNNRDRVIGIAKTENLVMLLASFLSACDYGHANHSFGYLQFEGHDGGFIVPRPVSLVERAGNAGLTRWVAL